MCLLLLPNGTSHCTGVRVTISQLNHFASYPWVLMWIQLVIAARRIDIFCLSGSVIVSSIGFMRMLFLLKVGTSVGIGRFATYQALLDTLVTTIFVLCGYHMAFKSIPDQ